MRARIRGTAVDLQLTPRPDFAFAVLARTADIACATVARTSDIASPALVPTSIKSRLAIAEPDGLFLIPAEFIRTGALAAAERPRSAIISPTSTNPTFAALAR